MRFKIAVVQMHVRKNSPEYNLRKAEIFIKKAASAKAQIIVFPEHFLSDPIVKKKVLVKPKYLHRKQFQALAKKYQIDLVSGSVVEQGPKGLQNTAYYIDSTGKIRAKYRKIHLWFPGEEEIIPGNKISVFNTKYGKIGLMICWDLMFPEVFRKMLKQGVGCVICPSNWSYGDAGKIGLRYDKQSEIKLVDSLCVSRAFENEIVFVYCNTAEKTSKNDRSVGLSQITVPFMGAINRLNHNKEAMFIQELDTKILDDAEKIYRIRKYLKEHPHS